MKCYNHHDRDAMGIDIITGKALCPECMEIYKNQIVEKNNEYSHKKVDSIGGIYDQIDNNKKYTMPLKIVMIIIGTMFVAFSINTLIVGNFDPILALIGIFFLILGLSVRSVKK